MPPRRHAAGGTVTIGHILYVCLVPRPGFSGKPHVPPKLDAKLVPQRVGAALKRHSGPSVWAVAQQLPPELETLLR